MEKFENQAENSESPILFLGISESYLRAFEIIWQNEFKDNNSFFWDKSLILHPITQLLGIALETAIKGLIVCGGNRAPITHNIEKLFQKISHDAQLVSKVDESLSNLEVPENIIESNPSKNLSELVKLYRNHHFHIQSLTTVYDRPYVSRYPVLGGHMVPDAIAIGQITKTLQTELKTTSRLWRAE